MESMFNKFKKKKGTFKINNEDSLVRVHHILMKNYGWINPKELTDHEEITITTYEFPIIIPKPWYKPWLWKLKYVKLESKSVTKKHGLTLPTMWNLIECIAEDNKAEQEAMKKSQRKGKR